MIDKHHAVHPEIHVQGVTIPEHYVDYYRCDGKLIAMYNSYHDKMWLAERFVTNVKYGDDECAWQLTTYQKALRCRHNDWYKELFEQLGIDENSALYIERM